MLAMSLEQESERHCDDGPGPPEVNQRVHYDDGPGPLTAMGVREAL